jgi:hypothetical protein
MSDNTNEKQTSKSKPQFANAKPTEINAGHQRSKNAADIKIHNRQEIAIANEKKSSGDSNTTGPRAKITGKTDEQ